MVNSLLPWNWNTYKCRFLVATMLLFYSLKNYNLSESCMFFENLLSRTTEPHINHHWCHYHLRSFRCRHISFIAGSKLVSDVKEKAKIWGVWDQGAERDWRKFHNEELHSCHSSPHFSPQHSHDLRIYQRFLAPNTKLKREADSGPIKYS